MFLKCARQAKDCQNLDVVLQHARAGVPMHTPHLSKGQGFFLQNMDAVAHA